LAAPMVRMSISYVICSLMCCAYALARKCAHWSINQVRLSTTCRVIDAAGDIACIVRDEGRHGRRRSRARRRTHVRGDERPTKELCIPARCQPEARAPREHDTPGVQ